VVPSLLACQRLFDAQGLDRNTAVAEGDTAFDPTPLPPRSGNVVPILDLDTAAD